MGIARKLGFALLLIAVVAVSGFTFDWISLSEPDAGMSASVTAGYGHLIIVPVGITPAGAAFEMGIPGVERLYAGAGLGYLGIEWDDTGDVDDYNLNYFTLDAYAKYIILDRNQLEEIVGVPLYLGVAAGIGFQVAMDDYSTYALSSDYGGLSGLAVALAGYDFGRSSVTAYAGLIDQSFSWSGEYHFRINESMHVGVFWVPLVGLGATFTLAF